MPTDLAKKKAAKKKEAAKARQRPRKGHEENGDAVTEPQVAEEKIEEANGRETTGDGGRLGEFPELVFEAKIRIWMQMHRPLIPAFGRLR